MKYLSEEMDDKKVLIQGMVDRMKAVLCVKKDVELASAIGVSKSQLAVWKIRDRLPLNECVAIAQEHGVSLDWLVLGRGQSNIEGADIRPSSECPGDGGALYVDVPAFDLPSYVDGDASQKWLRMPRDW